MPTCVWRRAGLLFTVCSEPYLLSEYGEDYGTESPTKLLERLEYGYKQTLDEEIVVLSQVASSHPRVLRTQECVSWNDGYMLQLF